MRPDDCGARASPPAARTLGVGRQIISVPPSRFAREAGTTCQPRWTANLERPLRGYRGYRLAGRYDQDALPRLTPEPHRETTYTDPAAGQPARHFHRVAVDALGQEGFPSAPVWYQREWQSFDQPCAREWHQ